MEPDVLSAQPTTLKMKKSVLLFTMILGFSHATMAQGKLGAFVGVGTMWYTGDLKETALPHPATIRWTANAGLWWQINARWGIQINYTAGRLYGDDQFAVSPSKRARNLNFKSTVHEIGLRGTYDILRNDRWKFLPYLSAGISALNFEPERDGVALRPLATEGVPYSNWTISIPAGIGAKYQFNCRWAMKLEANYHFTMTDRLDDVSGAYPDPENQVPFYSDPGNVASTRDSRGNPTFRDGMWDVNIGVIFYFLGCRNKNIYEDCDQLNKGVDMDMLREMYK